MAVQTVTAYTFFGVAPDCSQAALRQAYDAVVARHHPDTAWSTPTAAASKTGMQEVNRWYALVATEEARAAYDLTLKKQRQKQSTAEAPLPTASTKTAPAKVRRKTVGSRRQARQQQLVLSRPPLLWPVALFCSLAVFVAQAVAEVGGWTRRQAGAVWRRRRVLLLLLLLLLRVAGLVAAFTAAACLLTGWPANGTRWLGPCALPPPPPLAANRHYLQLGLADGDAAMPFATIRKAYHQAIRQHHPDKQAKTPWPLLCDHDRRLQAIGEAYAVLRDPQTRCAYDVQQQRRQSLWLRAPAQTCTPARWTHAAWEGAPGLSTAKDAVVLWRAGQVAVFQTVQSLWASVWASVRGLARRVVVLCGR